MNKYEYLLTCLIMLMLLTALVQIPRAHASDNMRMFFSKDYVNISIKVDATNQTDPDGNMTLRLQIACWTLNVSMGDLNVTVYGFRFGRDKILLQCIRFISAKTPLVFNHTREYNCTVHVPADVWGATLAELRFNGVYTRTNEAFDGQEAFTLTVIRNAYLEELERQFKDLNATYRALNGTFKQLNGTYVELNRTYWDLRQKYNSTQRNMNNLDNVTRAAVILGITTAFFVASTIYLAVRRPREPW